MAISVNQKSSGSAAQALKAPAKLGSTDWKKMIPRFWGRIKTGELIFFTSQLSLMLEIGTPLQDSLKAIRDQTHNAAFKEVIQSMVRDIEEGRQLSDAMKRHPRVFDTIFTSMVKAGESGGFLNKILDRIVEMQEKRQALLSQIKSALTYPIILCVLGFLVIVFVLTTVLPKFTAFFEGKEDILPVTTRFLMALSASLREYWWIYTITALGLAILLKVFKESEPGQALTDWLYVEAPLLARLSNKIYTCELLRTLGNLMESQVPLLEALEVTRSTIRNRFFRHFVDEIMEHVQQGGKFSQPFSTYPYILPSVKQMVATGEEVGDLPQVMLRLATFYDAEVDRELKAFSAMIEPLALIVMGAVVGLIVASVILPIFKLGHALH